MSEEQEKTQVEQQLAAIEIRSDEVQEIMGYIPHWIIRWGITLIFTVIFLFLVGSWFFKYPDVITSTIVVTTESPPAALVARTNGKIQTLFVKDNQKIKAGEFIAIIENAANYRHVFDLKEKLEKLKTSFPHYDDSGVVAFEENYSLGDLQSSYSSFLKSYSDYRYFIRLDYHSKKIEAVLQQIERQKLLIAGNERQTAIMEKEFKLSKQQYERSSKLFKDGIISRNDYESATSLYLQKEYALEGARSSLASQRITVSQLEQSVLDLRLKFKEQKKQLELSLNQGYDNLCGQVAQWEQNYLLKSPIEGVVGFTKYWSVNQNVKAGDTVVTIIPEAGGEIIGKVVLPIQGSGKVEVGQSVNIKFMNFPHVEYGMVRGVIKSRSLIPSDNNYALEVCLPQGLKSSYGEILPFSQEMQGIAEIITDDIRLLERIFKPIKSILERMESPDGKVPGKPGLK